MGMDFEWDAAKCAANIQKHRIDFEDAIGIFEGPILEAPSPRGAEMRWIALGETEGRVIAVIFTRREGVVRIISARAARKNEREHYRSRFPREAQEGQD